jgi:hypothetical protein
MLIVSVGHATSTGRNAARGIPITCVFVIEKEREKQRNKERKRERKKERERENEREQALVRDP